MSIKHTGVEKRGFDAFPKLKSCDSIKSYPVKRIHVMKGVITFKKKAVEERE